MKQLQISAFIVSLIFLLSSPVHASFMDDGLNAYYQKNWLEASESFKKAMKEDPNNSLALAYQIVCSFWLGTSEHELQTLQDNLLDNPNNQLAQIRLGFTHYTKSFAAGQRPEKALSDFREAARLGTSSLLHTGIGIVYFDLGNFTRAKKEFARAMDMNPKDVLAYEYMGRILLVFNNDPQSSLQYFKQQTDLVPAYPDGHFYYASALDALGKTDDAITEFQKTIRLDSLGVGRGIDAKISLGDYYLRNKQYEDARRTFKEALSLTPDDSTLQSRLTQVDKEQKAIKKR